MLRGWKRGWKSGIPSYGNERCMCLAPPTPQLWVRGLGIPAFRTQTPIGVVFKNRFAIRYRSLRPSVQCCHEENRGIYMNVVVTADSFCRSSTCCFTLKLPSPAPVTSATPSHLAQALLRHCLGIDQEIIREIAKHVLDEYAVLYGSNGNFSRGPSFWDAGSPKLGPPKVI